MAINIDQLRTQLGTMKTLEMITGAYSDISAQRISALRKAFEQNSVYFEQITQVYHSIRLTAMFEKARELKTIEARPLNPKTLHVALTSNKRFYGRLNRDIMERFTEETGKSADNRLVIGLTGKEFLEAHIQRKPYQIAVFVKDQPNKEEVDGLIRIFTHYDRVFLYYPRFVNMLSQSVARLDITYSPSPKVTPQQEIHYIFEPELPKILSFFQTQIRSLLFARVMLETELSRTATRLVVMDTAEKRAAEKVVSTRSEILVALQAIINRDLIETLSRRKRLLHKNHFMA